MAEEPVCEHLVSVTTLPEPDTQECAECVALGDTWLHLRMCVECGHVGCCDSSQNTHATKHNHSTGHALVRGIEPGERWVYCYIEDEAIEL